MAAVKDFSVEEKLTALVAAATSKAPVATPAKVVPVKPVATKPVPARPVSTPKVKPSQPVSTAVTGEAKEDNQ